MLPSDPRTRGIAVLLGSFVGLLLLAIVVSKAGGAL